MALNIDKVHGITTPENVPNVFLLSAPAPVTIATIKLP